VLEWESGETTYEPLDIIAKGDTMSCVEYTKCNGFIDATDWKLFRHLAKRDKKVEQMVNQAWLKSYWQALFGSLGFLSGVRMVKHLRLIFLMVTVNDMTLKL
jgi:hypothetical protein